MDATCQKIIDAAMILVRDKGYVATTTKDIAKAAGVNECTLFRKFKHKKDIILQGMNQEKWHTELTSDVFQPITGDLHTDLTMFMHTYMEHITSDFVRLSIGLRAPQIYADTAPLIMNIPQSFLNALICYFQQLETRGMIIHADYEEIADTILSATFGYTFLKASFQDQLIKMDAEAFIAQCVDTLMNGLINYI